jgi:PAS domain S-box-containing protein
MKPNLRILNLEDELTDAELNQAMLSARWPDCELIRVATRDEFVRALEEGSYDLILSDYTIPGFDGRAALELARVRRPEIPFIFVSGTIGEDTAIEALKNGATDYVLKHRPIRLIPAVDRALREVKERAECARAEEAMRQSEYKYRELFESLGDGAFLADEKTGKIIDTNRKAETMIGCQRTGILGHKQQEFLGLDNVRPVAGTKESDAYYTIAFECQMLPRSEKPFWVEVRSTRLTLFDHPLVLRMCHDLRDRPSRPVPAGKRLERSH